MIIVTGANGFIGSAMIRELNSFGHNDILAVDVVDRKERFEPLQKAQIKKFMLCTEFLTWLARSPDRSAVKGIFHIGAISSTTETDWDKLVVHNIELSKTLFKFCAEQSIPFIYASSGAVYGGGEKGFKDTTDPKEFQPLNLYGKSKKEFDQWALTQKTTPSRWIGLRYFNVYGPNEYHKSDMASVVYKAFLQIKSTGRLKLFKSHHVSYGDGLQLRDFVYIKDVTRWMWEIFENTRFPNGIYNLGFGKARTWLDLATQVFKQMKLPNQIDWIDIPQHIRNQYQYFTEADMTKAMAAGLSQSKFSLEAGIEDYLKTYLLSDDPYI